VTLFAPLRCHRAYIARRKPRFTYCAHAGLRYARFRSYAGRGNNGGDGYLLALLAFEHRLDVRVYPAGYADRSKAMRCKPIGDIFLDDLDLPSAIAASQTVSAELLPYLPIKPFSGPRAQCA